MRVRPMACGLVAVLALTGCTGDGDGGDPSEPATTEATETPGETAEATDEDSEEPTVGASPFVPTGPEVDPAGRREATEDPTEAATDEPTEAPTASALAAPQAEPASATADGSVFVVDTTRTRQGTQSAGCPIRPEASEDVIACVSGFARSHGDRPTAVVATSDGSTTTVTVYEFDAFVEWRSRLVAEGLEGYQDLRVVPWLGGDDAFVLDLMGSQQLITTDSAEGARVAATLPDDLGGQSVSYVARRVVLRLSELGSRRTTILAAPDAGGAITGTQLTPTTDDELAEDVALRVYAAWVSGRADDVADLTTPDVLEALKSTPQAGDVFTMVGTTCDRADGRATCRFRAQSQELTMEVARQDGAARVVRLR